MIQSSPPTQKNKKITKSGKAIDTFLYTYKLAENVIF